MDVRPRDGKYIVYASDYVNLDSDVYKGGGSDCTEILQSILDKAPEWGGLHLIMDGAGLVRGLKVHSNTTIECLNKSCGFYLADRSNRPLLRNANPDLKNRQDKSIRIIGGTYNFNCRNQEHHVKSASDGLELEIFGGERWVTGFEFFGVEDLLIRDVTLRNQRTFAMLIANWYRVCMENIAIDLPDIMYGENQDGIHFWGPGRFLTMRNISGCAGDDFIAIAPDEHDEISSITDVLIDGVFLEDADQAIRLLSRGEGRLDRVVIRNVMGTYKSFGFYIDPWYPGKGGNFGNIVIENIDLRQTYHKYNYTTPFLFRLGGNIESLTFRNIYHIDPSDERTPFEIGTLYYEGQTRSYNTRIDSLVIEGLYVRTNEKAQYPQKYLRIDCEVKNLLLKDVYIYKSNDLPSDDCFLEIQESAKIDAIYMKDIIAERIGKLITNRGGVKVLYLNNISIGETTTLIDDKVGGVAKIIQNQ